MAELGETEDPRALVPGDPAATRSAARQLAAYARDLQEAGQGLRRISTDGGWRGAAADRFRDAFDLQPPKWQDAGDAFDEGNRSLDAYAGTLEWGQRQAAEAIRLWKQGQGATATARAQYDQQAQAPRPAGAPPPGPFVDPGAELRQRAVEVLTQARGQVQHAGDDAADRVGRARDRAPEQPGFWDHVGDALGDVGDGLLDAGKSVVNGLASFGNAALHHPGDVAAVVGGAGLIVLGAGGELGGGLLDATGVGAVVGVPVNVASAGVIASGVGIAGTGLMQMAQDAAGEDRVEPLQEGSSGGSGDPGPAPGERIPEVGEPGRSPNVRQLPDEQAVRDLYADLSRGGTPLDRPGYNGEWVTAPDGTEIGLRGASKSGGATIDVKLPNGEVWKVHTP